MAEKIWVAHVETWQMQLMWAIDAKEAVRLGDYSFAPVGGYAPPTTARQPTGQPRTAVA